MKTELELLIEKLIKNPFDFSDKDLMELIDNKEFTYKHIKVIFNKLYDLNEGTILNASTASVGLIGKLNRKSQKRRNKKFFNKMRKGFRTKGGNKVILAEGDSWFEYPIFIRDIIDQLNKARKKDYAIHSLAHGADWLSNMIYENEYIEDLQIYSPDVFLISGGGNDMVGGNRLAKMVHSQSFVDKCKGGDHKDCKHVIKLQEFEGKKLNRTQELRMIEDNRVSESKIGFDDAKYAKGSAFLNKEFYGIINAFKVQYQGKRI